jgi:hypothetical protein
MAVNKHVNSLGQQVASHEGRETVQFSNSLRRIICIGKFGRTGFSESLFTTFPSVHPARIINLL